MYCGFCNADSRLEAVGVEEGVSVVEECPQSVRKRV